MSCEMSLTGRVTHADLFPMGGRQEPHGRRTSVGEVSKLSIFGIKGRGWEAWAGEEKPWRLAR